MYDATARARIRHLFDEGALDECWPWRGHLGPTGYGHFTFSAGGRRRGTPAHRAVYQLLVASIPPEMEIDHLCRNRACVNPAHLEVVTRAENIRRAVPARGVANNNGRKTHCPSGHPYDTENTYVTSKGRRQCRECTKVRVRDLLRQRRKAVA